MIAVAKAARVSPATVSRVLNHPEKVKPPTRKRVERTIDRLGYIRNRAGQTIHGRRSGTVGLIVPTMTNTIFSEVTQSFSDAMDQAGFAVLLATNGFDPGREVFLLRKFIEHRVDGVALIGLEHDEALFTLVERQNVPTITTWSFAPDSRLPCFGADNREAGHMAARHLIELGHRKIVCAFPPTENNERAKSRAEGAMAALRAQNMSSAGWWHIDSPFNVASAKHTISGVLASADLPTALICGNDIIAQGALFAAQRHGLSVPRDISIVGIGDFPGSADLEPGLTTVRIPAREIGREAGDYLSRAIIAQDDLPLHRQKFALWMKIRGTAAALSGPPPVD